MSKGSSLDSKVKVWTSSWPRMGTAVGASFTPWRAGGVWGGSSPDAISQSCSRLQPTLPTLSGWTAGLPQCPLSLLLRASRNVFYQHVPFYLPPYPSLSLFKMVKQTPKEKWEILVALQVVNAQEKPLRHSCCYNLRKIFLKLIIIGV